MLLFQEKDDSTRKKKESIVDLSRFIDKKIRVKFQGGREGMSSRSPSFLYLHAHFAVYCRRFTYVFALLKEKRR